MEADGRRAVELDQHGRKQVLAAVLLHVVEAARPVDGASDFARRDRRVGDVRDALAFVDDLDHRRVSDGSRIERLAAGGRIECGAVQVDTASAVARFDHVSAELAQVGIGVIEAFGHTHSNAPFFQAHT